MHFAVVTPPDDTNFIYLTSKSKNIDIFKDIRMQVNLKMVQVARSYINHETVAECVYTFCLDVARTDKSGKCFCWDIVHFHFIIIKYLPAHDTENVGSFFQFHN